MIAVCLHYPNIRKFQNVIPSAYTEIWRNGLHAIEIDDFLSGEGCRMQSGGICAGSTCAYPTRLLKNTRTRVFFNQEGLYYFGFSNPLVECYHEAPQRIYSLFPDPLQEFYRKAPP